MTIRVMLWRTTCVIAFTARVTQSELEGQLGLTVVASDEPK